MTDQAAEGVADEQPKPARGRGAFGFLLALALLMATAALSAAGYLYFLLVQLDPYATLERELAAAAAERRTLQEQLAKQQAQWQEALTDTSAQLLERLQTTEASLAAALQQPAAQAPSAEPDWRLAELEYLLRAANQRLLMGQDIVTALEQLQAADEILKAVGDVGLQEVRAALSREILALDQVDEIDAPGLYLRLDALKQQLSALALAPALSQYRVARLFGDGTTHAGAVRESAAQDGGGEPAGFLATLAKELRGLVRFRRIDSEARPLLAPDDAVYLELNMRLLLEQAQLAVLKRDPVVYAASLASAEKWMLNHLDREDPQVQGAIRALTALQQEDLNMPLPDISTSLSELIKVRRGT